MKILGFLSKTMIVICLLSTQVSTASTNNKLSKEATNCSVLAAVLTGTTSICPGDTATLTVALSGSSMTTTPNYSVSISNGVTTKTATRVGDGNVTFTILSSEAGFYAVIEVKDDECIGTATGSAVVTVNQATQIIQQPVDVYICPYNSTSLSVEAVGDNLTYEWFKTPLTTPKGTSKNYDITSVKVGDNGDYTVKVTGVCGTVTSQMVVIRVSQTEFPMVPMSASEKVVCKGGAVTFTAMPTGGGISPQYTFKNLSTNTILAESYNNTLTLKNVTSTSEIEVSMLSNSVCLDPATPNPVKATTTVTVVEPEQANAGQDITTCSMSANLGANISLNGHGLWTCNSGTLSDPTSSTSTLSGLASSTPTTCVWTVANSVCASSSDTVIINKIGDVAVPNIYLDNVNVTGEIVDLCLTGVHALRGERSDSLNGDYPQWSTVSGTSVAGVSKQIANHGVLDLVSEGETVIRYTIANTFPGCGPETRYLTLNVHPEPVASVVADITDTCKNVPYINLTTGMLGVTDLGTWTSALKPAISGSPTAWKLNGSDLQVGNNTVVWNVSNVGCGSKIASQTIKIDPFTTPNVSLTALPTQCSGNSVTYIAVGTFGGPGAFYTWGFSGDNLVPVNTGSNKFTIPNIQSSGTVSVTYTSSERCRTKDFSAAWVPLNVVKGPQPRILLETDTIICSLNPITITAVDDAVFGGTTSYKWYRTNEQGLRVFLGNAISLNDTFRLENVSVAGEYSLSADNGVCAEAPSNSVNVGVVCEPNTIEAILSQGQVFGCMDALASNYNSNATAENGSCEYTQTNLSQAKGCSDVKALNYNELVSINVPSSCIYEQSNAFKPIKVLIEDKINTELFTAKVFTACGLDYSKIIDSATVTEVKGLNDKVNVSFKVWQGVKSYDVDVVFDVDLNTILSQTNYLFEATISCANVQARTTAATEGVKIRALLKTSQITGVFNTVSTQVIQLYPNPVLNELNFDANFKIQKVEIFNAMGQSFSVRSLSDSAIDVSTLNSGIYTVKIQDETGTVYRTKFIKE
jgi:hypothetical protein